MSTVPTIHLPRKREKRFKLGDQEFSMSLDARAIDYFQKSRKQGFLKVMSQLEKKGKNGEHDLESYLHLLGACIKYPNGRSVGADFLRQFDEFVLVNELLPLWAELLPQDLPEAKKEAEKK